MTPIVYTAANIYWGLIPWQDTFAKLSKGLIQNARLNLFYFFPEDSTYLSLRLTTTVDQRKRKNPTSIEHSQLLRQYRLLLDMVTLIIN